MKILIIQPTGDKFGHYGTQLSRTAQALCKLGHDVVMYTNRLNASKYIDEEVLFDVVEYKDGTHEFNKFEVNKVKSPFKYWLNYFYLSFMVSYNGLKYGREKEFDIIYISDAEFLMASIVLFLRRKSVVPIMMQVNASNFSFSEYPGSIFKKSYKAFQAFFFRKALDKYIHGISILGEWHEARLRSQLKIRKNFQIFNIPDGAAPDTKKPPKADARAKIAVEEDGDLLLFLGILRIDKGLEVLSEALRELSSRGRYVNVIIAGHPHDYQADVVREMFYFGKDSSININLRLNYIDEKDLVNYYSAADALLLPYNSLYKGSTGPLMKGACTFGVPVIVSNQGQMGRLASLHNLGYLFETENPISLADTICEFLETDAEERQIIKESALDLGSKNSWDEIAGSFADAFGSLTACKRPPSK